MTRRTSERNWARSPPLTRAFSSSGFTNASRNGRYCLASSSRIASATAVGNCSRGSGLAAGAASASVSRPTRHNLNDRHGTPLGESAELTGSSPTYTKMRARKCAAPPETRLTLQCKGWSRSRVQSPGKSTAKPSCCSDGGGRCSSSWRTRSWPRRSATTASSAAVRAAICAASGARSARCSSCRSARPRRPSESCDASTRIHDQVNGRLDRAVGRFPAGTPYSARDPELLCWVHATLIESMVVSYELFVDPLTSEEKNRYALDATWLACELGVEPHLLPRDYPAVEAHVRARYESGDIVVGDARPGSGRRTALAAPRAGRRAAVPGHAAHHARPAPPAHPRGIRLQLERSARTVVPASGRA